MSDLIRRDDALRSIEEWYAKICKPETITELGNILAGYSAYKDIAKIPAVDAVEVIKCKYCKHFTEGMAIGMCKRDPEKPIFPMEWDNFCKYGERREER